VIRLDKIINLKILDKAEAQILKKFLDFYNDNTYSSGINIFDEYTVQILCETIYINLEKLSYVNKSYGIFCNFFDDYIIYIYQSYKNDKRIKYLEVTRSFIEEYLNSAITKTYISKTIIPPIFDIIKEYILDTQYFYVKMEKGKEEVLRPGNYLCFFTYFYGRSVPLETLINSANPIFKDIINYMKKHDLTKVYFLRENLTNL